MGFSIGDSVNSFASLRTGGGAASFRARAGLDAAGVSPRTPRVDTLQVGFGENTVSVPGLTLRTVDKNFENARNVNEIQKEIRARMQEEQARVREAQQDAAQATRAKETAPEETSDVGAESATSFERPEASAQLRFFSESSAPAERGDEAVAIEGSSVIPPGNSASERLNLLV